MISRSSCFNSSLTESPLCAFCSRLSEISAWIAGSRFSMVCACKRESSKRPRPSRSALLTDAFSSRYGKRCAERMSRFSLASWPMVIKLSCSSVPYSAALSISWILGDDKERIRAVLLTYSFSCWFINLY